jgi:hypothetical protein
VEEGQRPAVIDPVQLFFVEQVVVVFGAGFREFLGVLARFGKGLRVFYRIF